MGGFVLSMEHDLHEVLRLFDVGMRRRQRQHLASKRDSSMQITDLGIADAKTQTRDANVRSKNSSVFSFITRASWCRPRSEYVAVRLLIAVPRAENVNLSHQRVEPKDTEIASHLCQDGSPAARAAETQASSPSSQEHLGAAQVQSTWQPDCSLRRLEQETLILYYNQKTPK
jgi:hypothetical protein